MKTVTYKHEDIVRMTAILGSVSISGFAAINAFAEVGKIIDSGEVKEIRTPKKEVTKNETD